MPLNVLAPAADRACAPTRSRNDVILGTEQLTPRQRARLETGTLRSPPTCSWATTPSSSAPTTRTTTSTTCSCRTSCGNYTFADASTTFEPRNWQLLPAAARRPRRRLDSAGARFDAREPRPLPAGHLGGQHQPDPDYGLRVDTPIGRRRAARSTQRAAPTRSASTTATIDGNEHHPAALRLQLHLRQRAPDAAARRPRPVPGRGAGRVAVEQLLQHRRARLAIVPTVTQRHRASRPIRTTSRVRPATQPAQLTSTSWRRTSSSRRCGRPTSRSTTSCRGGASSAAPSTLQVERRERRVLQHLNLGAPTGLLPDGRLTFYAIHRTAPAPGACFAQHRRRRRRLLSAATDRCFNDVILLARTPARATPNSSRCRSRSRSTNDWSAKLALHLHRRPTKSARCTSSRRVLELAATAQSSTPTRKISTHVELRDPEPLHRPVQPELRHFFGDTPPSSRCSTKAATAVRTATSSSATPTATASSATTCSTSRTARRRAVPSNSRRRTSRRSATSSTATTT